MKKKTAYKEDIYEENPFGSVKLGKKVRLSDLLSPAEIAAAERTTKVTLALGEEAIQFFKQQAKKFDMPYQVMIRRLLDDYVQRSH